MQIDIDARMNEIKADPERYIGVLERAIKRRNKTIAGLEGTYRKGYLAGLRKAEEVCRKYIMQHSQKDIDEHLEVCMRVRAAQKLLGLITNEACLSREGVIAELKRLGWKKTRHGWNSPHHKRLFQGITLREAASLAALSSDENLSGY